MEIGMLWFDNDPGADLTSKVNQAAAYYQGKYGEEPNLCFVHPSMIPDRKTRAGAVSIRSSVSVLPHHLWIGVQPEITQL
jgi:hypothetical protein